MTAQALLHDPGDRVIVGGLVPGKLLGRLLQALLLQRIEVEGKRRLEDFLEKVDEALRPGLRIRVAGKRLVQLAGGADPYLVPVVEVLAKEPICPVGLLSGDALTTESIEELLKHGKLIQLGRGLLMLVALGQGREYLGYQALF